MLIFYLLASYVMLWCSNFYAQYYAHVKICAFIRVYSLVSKTCDDCSIRVYLKFYTLTGAQIIIIVDVLLEYIVLQFLVKHFLLCWDYA